MWEDMILYWAWRGPIPRNGRPPAPTVKRIEYAKVTHSYRHLNGDKKGKFVETDLAVGVWDDDKYTPLNRNEVERFRKNGATVELTETQIHSS